MNKLLQIPIIIFLAILAPMCPSVYGQQIDKPLFELIDESHGLSNHLVHRLALDSAGYLWVGTNDGLNRYDGRQFKVFKNIKGDSTSLRDDINHTQFVDRKGRLWVAFPGSVVGLLKEDCQCFEYYQVKDTANPLHPEVFMPILHQGRDGTLWMSAWGTGLVGFHPETGKMVRYNLPGIHPGYSDIDRNNYNAVNAIYEDADGWYWLCSMNGLYHFDPKTGQMEHLLHEPINPQKSRNDCYNSIYPNGAKGLWLTAWGGGISYFDKVTRTFKVYKYHEAELSDYFGNIMYMLAPKSDHEFWVASDDMGLGVFDTITHKFRFDINLTSATGSNGPLGVYQIVVAPGGTVFLPSAAGLLKYDPAGHLFRFQRLPIASTQSGDKFEISKIFEDPARNAIYFATEFGNGLNVMDTRTGKLRAFPVDLHPDPKAGKFSIVSGLLNDRNDRLWVLSLYYIYEFDKKRQRMTRIERPFLEDEYNLNAYFTSIREDPEGDLWVITQQGGLHRFFPDTKKLSPPVNAKGATSESPQSVQYVEWDKHGRMWVMGMGFLCMYDKNTDQFIHPLSPETESITNGSLRGMTTDRIGNIWVAITRKGLLRIDTQDPDNTSARLLTKDDGLPSIRFASINSDYDGNIWMASLAGVLYMNPETFVFRTFNKTVGMEATVISMRFIKAGNGAFYIVTPGKYCKVDMEGVRKTAPMPRVYIDKFSIFNKEVPGTYPSGSSVTLQPGENAFSFDFSCLDFSNQAFNKFAYMLEGWDNDWVEAGSRRHASYTNLDGGDYTFKVKVANREGVWSEPIYIRVHILTPFYKQPWFGVLIALLFSGVIYGLYLFRIRQIEKTEQLKTEFNRQLAETRLEALRAQMNPHFIFNCLNSINRYIIKSDIKTSSLYLTRFARLIRLILDNSAHKKVVLSSELEALRLYIDMEALRFDHKFTFDIEVEPSVDADNVEIPPLIIQPYVENAIWHGLLHKESGGHLSVRVSGGDQDMLTCVITDNGIGREKAGEYKSMNAPTRQSVGMKLTEERLKFAGEGLAVGGSQQIIDLYDASGAPAGTQIILTIPV